MRMCILILGALLAGLGGLGGPVFAQTPAQPTNAGPIQPWGLPPLPQGVGPVEKFADIGNTPQGKFLEGGAFDDQGNLWFVAIGSGVADNVRSNDGCQLALLTRQRHPPKMDAEIVGLLS